METGPSARGGGVTPTTNPTIGDQGAATGTATATPPGWHRDPLGRFPLRYWDGTTWTENVVNPQRQVGIDVTWARAAEAARAEARTPAPAPARAETPPTTPTPAGGPSPTRPDTPTAAHQQGSPPETANPAAPAAPVDPVTTDADAREPDPPVERFDISPEA